jgi:hypothetical protein
MNNLNGARCVVLACMLAVSGVAVGANGVQARHDDFVRRPGDPQIDSGRRTIPLPPARAHYLLTGVRMTSSVGLGLVNFAGFTNNTPYTLMISLTYSGAPQDPHGAMGVVNGVGVGWSMFASTFEVPPGAQYGFSTDSSFTISAWVVGGFDEDPKLPTWTNLVKKFGLPTAQDFTSPVRLQAGYAGCVNVVSDGVIQNTEYYYQGGRWTDGSDSGKDGVYTPGFGNAVPGSAPAQPGQCVVRDVTPGYNNGDGGGGPGDGDS